MSAVLQAWDARTEAERRVLAAVGFLAIAALVAALVWLPLERARARLAAELPRLRGSIATLERDAAEAKRLRALPPAGADAASPLASLATDGGGLPGARVTVLDERRVRVSGADVGFAALLEWLGNAQSTHGMRVASARIDALPAAGRVRVELTLTRG